MSNRSTRLLKSSILASLILGLATVAGYFYWQYHLLATANPERELQTITKRLRKFMDLPESPPPTLATVTEKEKLQQQDFFQKAENGDKVLIYLSEGVAILYRPSTEKVIAVGPVRQTESLESAEQTELRTNQAETAEPVAITLYNGSTVAGAARATEAELADLSFAYSVVARANAAKASYTQTIVVDLDGNFQEQAAELAELLDGNVGNLPNGEQPPSNGGLLVIIGQDASLTETAAPTPAPTSAENQ